MDGIRISIQDKSESARISVQQIATESLSKRSSNYREAQQRWNGGGNSPSDSASTHRTQRDMIPLNTTSGATPTPSYLTPA
eukprot:6456609-Amphidinium_carterae.3